MPIRDKLSNIIDWVSNTKAAELAGDAYNSSVGKSARQGVGTLVDVLQQPSKGLMGMMGAPKGHALEYGWKGLTGEHKNTDFDWVLGQKGMKEGALRTTLGLAGDIVLDPLNVVGPVAKAAGVYPKLRNATMGALKSGKLGRDVVGKFSKFELLPEGIRDAVRLNASELSHQPHTVETRVRSIYDEAKNLAKRDLTDAEREHASRILATGNWDNLPEGADPNVLKHIVSKGREYLDELYQNELAAKVMPEGSKLPDYFPYLIRRQAGEDTDEVLSRIKSVINPKNPHAMPRVTDSYDEFLQVARGAGREPITDVFEALLQRGLKGSKAASTGNFIQGLLKNPAVAANVVAEPAKEALWKKISPGKYKGLPLLDEVEKYAFEPAVAKYLDSLTLSHPKGVWEDLYDKGHQMFKTGATTIKPGFHINNLKSNFWQTALQDDSANALEALVKAPLSFAKGGLTLRHIKRGQSVADIGDVAGSTITDYLKKHGIVGGSIHTLNDIAGPEGKKRLAEVLEQKATNPLDWWVRKGRNVGSDIEDSSKIGFFLDYMKTNPKGLSGQALLDDALFATKKTLFDYNEVTDFERNVMKRLMPFYTFGKKNVPLQIQGLIEKPFLASGLGHVQDAGKNLTEAYRPEEVLREGDLPEYATKGVPIQIPNLTTRGEPMTLDPYMPVNDLSLLNPFNPLNTLQDVASRMSPFVKPLPELGLNRLFYSGLPIHDEDLGLLDNPLQTPVGNIPGKDLIKYILSNIPTGQFAVPMTDLGTPKGVDKQKLLQMGENWITGLNAKQYDWTKLQKGDQFERAKEKRKQTKLRKLTTP